VNQLNKTIIGKPQAWLIKAASGIGLDYSELYHEKTNDFVNHCLNQHGNDATEKRRGQLPVTLIEMDKIPGIIKNPDCAIVGIKKYGQLFNAYLKCEANSSIIYYEEVLNSKKTKSLRSKTMYIKRGSVDSDTFLKIVSNNAHTDISNVKMVVGAGGNPGGEAE
jgi:hypothetical protein